MKESRERDGPAVTESASSTILSGTRASSTLCRSTRPNRRRMARTFFLPSSSPSFLLLAKLAAIIFAAFASSSSSFVQAAATTTTSGVQEEVEETASVWIGDSSRSVQEVVQRVVQEDELLDEEELSSSCSRHVDVLEAEIFILRGERDACEAHVGNSLDLKTRLDKWEPKKWMSATAARSATEGTSSATTQANVDLSAALTLPSFEERRLVSVGSDMVVSSSDGVTRVGGRRLESCPTFQYDDDSNLDDGWNLLSESCTLGAEITVTGAGKRMKIKKDPSAVGVVEVDRQATSANLGRHFEVLNGAVLEVDGLTLTGGYYATHTFNFKSYAGVRLSFNFFAPLIVPIKNIDAAAFACVPLFFFSSPSILWTF